MRTALATFALLTLSTGAALAAPPFPSRSSHAMTWTNPTAYTDGTAIPAGALQGTNLYRQLDGSAWQGYAGVAAPATVFVDPTPGPGSTCYYATTVGTDGLESGASNTLCFPRPKAPGPLQKR